MVQVCERVTDGERAAPFLAARHSSPCSAWGARTQRCLHAALPAEALASPHRRGRGVGDGDGHAAGVGALLVAQALAGDVLIAGGAAAWQGWRGAAPWWAGTAKHGSLPADFISERAPTMLNQPVSDDNWAWVCSCPGCASQVARRVGALT